LNKPEDIKLQLENLKKKISLIDSCDLKKNAKKMVFSDGNFNSQIMIVGEGPGEKEDEIGKPFVGDAGNLLNKMLSAINIKRESVYITNVVNYRPPNNRKPSPAEINRYSTYLREHILIINPKILIIMGSTAMEAVVGNNIKISKERGKWKEIIIKDKTYASIITFHPAYLLRQADQKKYSWSDLKEIRKKIDELNINI
jgi:DNA polymerase